MFTLVAVGSCRPCQALESFKAAHIYVYFVYLVFVLIDENCHGIDNDYAGGGCGDA